MGRGTRLIIEGTVIGRLAFTPARGASGPAVARNAPARSHDVQS